jgi:hypothetical protein
MGRFRVMGVSSENRAEGKSISNTGADGSVPRIVLPPGQRCTPNQTLHLTAAAGNETRVQRLSSRRGW